MGADPALGGGDGGVPGGVEPAVEDQGVIGLRPGAVAGMGAEDDHGLVAEGRRGLGGWDDGHGVLPVDV